MAKFCHNCHGQFIDEAVFCPECGAPLKNEPVPESEPAPAAPQPETAPIAPSAPQPQPQPQYQPQPQPQPQYQPQPQPQPQYQQQYQQAPQPQYQPVYAEEPRELYPAVSTGLYFLLNILMPIPLVGFILSIVLTFAPRNKSLKNYARAYLIANLIILGIALLALIIVIVFSVVVGASITELISTYSY